MVAIIEKIKEHKLLLIAFALSGLMTMLTLFKGTEEKPLEIENIQSIDTYIPKGFVLVPISVQNSDSLDSVLGQKGVVDLYLTDPLRPEKPKKVASRIKILRAPLNPSVFAVLAPENEASKLVVIDQPFTVMVQNPKRIGTRIEKKPPKKQRKSRITVEEFEDG